MSKEKYTIKIYNEMKKFCNLRKDGKVHSCFLTINDFGPIASCYSLSNDCMSNYLDEILVMMQDDGFEIIDIKMTCNTSVLNASGMKELRREDVENPPIYDKNSDVSQYMFCIIYK